MLSTILLEVAGNLGIGYGVAALGAGLAALGAGVGIGRRCRCRYWPHWRQRSRSYCTST